VACDKSAFGLEYCLADKWKSLSSAFPKDQLEVPCFFEIHLEGRSTIGPSVKHFGFCK